MAMINVDYGWGSGACIKIQMSSYQLRMIFIKIRQSYKHLIFILISLIYFVISDNVHDEKYIYSIKYTLYQKE